MKAGYLYGNELESEKGPNEKDVLLPTEIDKSTISSILANIYFHELDKFMKKLIEETSLTNNLDSCGPVQGQPQHAPHIQKKSKLKYATHIKSLSKERQQRKNESNNEAGNQQSEEIESMT